MGPNQYLMLSLFLLAVGSASSAAYISKSALESSAPTGRTLLNSRTTYPLCPIDFNAQDSTILTSQCKGPDYSKTPCCDAFKKFACPFADQLNDLTNDCATAMFRSISPYYPPGTFSGLCTEGPQGMGCPS